jgi:hypothetical protein
VTLKAVTHTVLIGMGLTWIALPGCAADAVSAAKPAPSGKWSMPRTPDGQPDLSGVWSNASSLPLERPKDLGSKEFFTADEIEQMQSKAAEAAAARNVEAQGGLGVAHYDLSQFGLDRAHTKVAKSMRTSILTGPDGKIPPMIPEAQKRVAERAAANRGHQFDSAQNRGLSERCILWGNEGPPILPQGYNSNLEIVQGPGYVAIEIEMIHDVRIIPLDGRPHPPAYIKQWFGDSRGHWEGDTLVVDTTNFSDETRFHNATGNMHVVERFTRTAPDTVLYQFTVEDPQTWAKSWSGEVPFLKTSDRIYEYACHEGNKGMANILSGARADEAKKAASVSQ